MRRARHAFAVVALVATTCAAQDSITLPHCQEEGPTIIMAQSVPTAEQIPCLDGLPQGWSLARGDINQSGSTFTFDSDRAGAGAAVLTFGDSCDVADAVSLRSDFADVERYERNIALDPSFRSERTYVFDGGCVQWIFDFDRGVSGTLTVGLDERLQFVSRADFEAAIDESFMDVDL